MDKVTVRLYRLSLVFAASLASAQVGIITTVAGSTPVNGSPVRGFSGDGGPATAASLSLAEIRNQCDPATFEQGVHIAVDAAGNLYIADGANHRVRRVSPNGLISTVAGSGERPPINDRCEPSGSVGDNGPATLARLYGPSAVAIHPTSDLIIADQQNNRIRRVTSAGSIATVAGSGMHNIYAPNIPALSSPMDWPSALAVDANGALYFAEIHSHRVARLTSDGRIVTIAGNGFPGFIGDGGPATSARLRNPIGLAVDGAGNVYIADSGNHRIRKVTPAGVISTVAGTGQPGNGGDGAAIESALNTPMDVAVDTSGAIYIADTLNHKIRRVDTSGLVTTIAGDGVPGRGPDDVAATESSLHSPAGLALAVNGDLYIADWQNYLVRKVSFSAHPAVTRGGIVNAATLASSALAPGTIISVWGTQLAAFTRTADSIPLAKQMDDVTVEVNGVAVPLLYVSPTQINAQLPHDLAPGETSLRVRNSLGVSSDYAFRVTRASPGVFQLDGNGRAAALNQDNSINGPDNPERAGNVAILFLTGLGEVTPSVRSGEAAPLDLLSRGVLPVSVTVGGANAQVLFAGLTPGSVGLAQINIVIPEGTSPNVRVPILVNVDGTVSNTVFLSVR